MPRLASLLAVALLAVCPTAQAADYCIDAAAGRDTNSGLCPGSPWQTFQPTICRAFSSGDRVLVAPGTYNYPQTGWYMTPGLSWIGSGIGTTTVVISFSPGTPVPFVRFRQGAAGSGPLCRQCASPCPFTAATVLSDMTLRNNGNASPAIEIIATSGTAAPRIERVQMEGFATGVLLHPSDDDRAAATVSATISQDVILDATVAAIDSFADNFYGRTVTESSTIENTIAQSADIGVRARTLVQDLRERAAAVARPTLRNDTIQAGSGSGLLLISYLDDGTGVKPTKSDGGVLQVSVQNGIFTGSARFGIEEYSPFTEPLTVASNALGGNALGDYLDEGSTTLAAPSVGTGNLSVVPAFVDAAQGDFHVMAGSPTLDRLAAASAPALDVDGQVRPQGSLSDLGADEYVPCLAAADATASVDPPPCSGQGGLLDGRRSTIDAVCAAGLRHAWYDGPALLGTGATLAVTPAAPTTYRLRASCADPKLSACFAETTRSMAKVTSAPRADAGVDGEGCETPGAPAAFALTGQASAVPPATVSRVAWSATAGSFSSTTTPATTLTLPAGFSGPVTATFTVTDSDGCTAADTVLVTVRPAPAVSAGADTAQCQLPGSSAVFNLAGSASAVAPATLAATQWTATLGTIAAPATPSTTLSATATAATQTITATLRATDSLGCTRSDAAILTLRPRPVAVPGGPYSVMQSGGASTDIPLDGSGSSGEGALAHAWSTDLGSFVDTGTQTSALVRPTLRIVNNNTRQTANVCLTVTSANGCAASRQCGTAVVRITAAQPPNDIAGSLRARKSAPASIVLSWQDAPADALHDLALGYEVWSSSVKCGPFARASTVPRVPGTNSATLGGLAPPPSIQFYSILSTNDGGVSVPAPLDGSTCR